MLAQQRDEFLFAPPTVGELGHQRFGASHRRVARRIAFLSPRTCGSSFKRIEHSGSRQRCSPASAAALARAAARNQIGVGEPLARPEDSNRREVRDRAGA